MERHCNHRLNAAKVYIDNSVIVGHITRVKLTIALTTAMYLIEILNFIISSPYWWKTCCLRCHNINSDSEIGAQVRNTRSYELHNLILDISVTKYCTDNRKRNILRSHTLHRFPCKIYGNHTRHGNIIGLVKKLLCKFSAALTYSHCTESTITRMGIWAKNHRAALRQSLSCKLMDDSLMRRNIHSAVLLRTAESEHVVILIYRSADRCSCSLYNSDKSYIMGCKLIKSELKLIHVIGCIVLL